MKRRIVIAGDYCPRGRVAESIEKKNYDIVLGGFRDVLTNSDYAIVNLECPVAGKDAAPIEKHGPNLSCTQQAMEALKWAGFDCVTLANNHFLDFGAEGVKKTIDACEATGLGHVGGGCNLREAASTLFVDIDGPRIAIIRRCFQLFPWAFTMFTWAWLADFPVSRR